MNNTDKQRVAFAAYIGHDPVWQADGKPRTIRDSQDWELWQDATAAPYATAAADGRVGELEAKVDEHDSEQASIADFLNTLLRENYGEHEQLKTWTDDFRPALTALVTGAHHSGYYASKSELQQAELNVMAIQGLLDEASARVEAMRERCADIAVQLQVNVRDYPRTDGDYPYYLRQLIAAAIRDVEVE